MKIKKFVASSLPEALSKIKQELGEEAVILKTRFMNGGPRAAKGERLVEVTAAIDGQTSVRPILQPEEEKTSLSRNRITYDPAQGPAVPSSCEQRPVEIKQTPSELLGDIKNELTLLRKSIESIPGEPLFGQPDRFALEVARCLVEKALPEDIAVKVAKELASENQDWRNQSSVWKKVKEILVEMLAPGQPVEIIERAATVILLIGPTGSGKTSAAARLAFHFTTDKGIPATLISTDTFRSDSKEQLKSLAAVIGCPFIAISSPEELALTLKSFKSGIVIIDTTGISNNKSISALVPFVGAANPHEVHLVIPADMPSSDICRLIVDHPDLGVDRLLVTKLDQSQNRGGVVGAAVQSGVKMSYHCASREMPGLFDVFRPEVFVSALIPGLQPDPGRNVDTLEVVGW